MLVVVPGLSRLSLSIKDGRSRELSLTFRMPKKPDVEESPSCLEPLKM